MRETLRRVAARHSILIGSRYGMDLANDDRIRKLIEQMQTETDARKISALMTELLAALDEKRASAGSSGESDRRMAS